MTGSHMDTVPGAGHLDGALGVLVGLECLRAIKEQGLALHYPLESVAFTDEEGRFGGMFGSQAICGQATPEQHHAGPRSARYSTGRCHGRTRTECHGCPARTTQS